MDKSNGRERFDCTPEQYHAGLDKLWAAIPDKRADDSVYDAVVRNIDDLKSEVMRLRERLYDAEAKANPHEIDDAFNSGIDATLLHLQDRHGKYYPDYAHVAGHIETKRRPHHPMGPTYTAEQLLILGLWELARRHPVFTLQLRLKQDNGSVLIKIIEHHIDRKHIAF